jgi:hypothetical protein
LAGKRTQIFNQGRSRDRCGAPVLTQLKTTLPGLKRSTDTSGTFNFGSIREGLENSYQSFWKTVWSLAGDFRI